MKRKDTSLLMKSNDIVSNVETRQSHDGTALTGTRWTLTWESISEPRDKISE